MVTVIPAKASSAQTEGDERPDIVNVRLYAEDAYLKGDIQSRGLFSQRIAGTIQSGLPAVFELFYHLVESRGKTENRGVFSWSLKYDVWEDTYSLSSGDSIVYFPTFKSMRDMIQNLRGISIVPAGLLKKEYSYRIRISVAINPLQGTDEKKIAGWIDEKVRSGEEGSWREHVLNVNDLISWFFTKGKPPVNRSDWFESEPFTLPSLEKPPAGQRSDKGSISPGTTSVEFSKRRPLNAGEAYRPEE